MMILAVDVQYNDEALTALVAGVVFESFVDSESKFEYTTIVDKIAEYIPGQFYQRELPCIQALLEDMDFLPDLIIVDGYVDLRPEYPGLGRHLYSALNGKIPIIGVAKSHFYETHAVKIYRNSSRPLFVTSVGIDIQEAASSIKDMHGEFRLPTLLKRVDSLCRGVSV